MKFWTKEETQIIINNMDKSYHELYTILRDMGYNRSPEAIRKRISRLDRMEDEENIEINNNISSDIILASKTNILNKYIDMLHEIENTQIMQSIKVKKKITPSQEKEAIVLMLSDLHIGKKVTDHNGNILYDSSIAVNYLEKIINRLKIVMEHAGKGTDIDEVVILMLGDIVDSESIYDTQPFHLDMFVADQVKLATEILWNLIIEASNIPGIKKVNVVGCRGNHGRMTFGAEDSNWDNVIHNNLYFVSTIANNPKIEISKNCGEFNIAEVKGHRILIRHNAPSQTETAAAKAKFAGWIDIHKIDAVCYGHYHHYSIGTFNNRTIVRNGSLPGSDDLAERMSVKNDPCQVVFGVSKERLPTFIYPLTFQEKKMF